MKYKMGDYIIFFKSQEMSNGFIVLEKNKRYKIEETDPSGRIFYVLTEGGFPWCVSIG